MIKRKIVLEFLRLKQETDGGFTGTDLTDLAEILGVTPRGLRWRISNWIKTDKEFSQFIYLRDCY
jgi:AcrR family transcriptional regulator